MKNNAKEMDGKDRENTRHANRNNQTERFNKRMNKQTQEWFPKANVLK